MRPSWPDVRRVGCLCYPSLAAKGEGLSLAPFEALAAGAVRSCRSSSVTATSSWSGENGYTFDHAAPGGGCHAGGDPRDLLADAPRRHAVRRRAQESARRFDYAKPAALARSVCTIDRSGSRPESRRVNVSDSEAPYLGQNCTTPYRNARVLARWGWAVGRPRCFAGVRARGMVPRTLLKLFGADITEPGRVVIFPTRNHVSLEAVATRRARWWAGVTIYNLGPVALRRGANTVSAATCAPARMISCAGTCRS